MGKVMVVEKGLPVAPAGTRKIDLVGKVFDRPTVIRQDGYAYGNAKWLCQCSCGAAVSIRGDYLRRGKAKSCGCLRIEKITTHGETNSLEYSSWRSMIDRCYNPKNISYEYYGGRGITVCDRWKDSFENFLADVGRRPSPQHTADRYPDTSGNYEPTNFRWATKSEQSLNQRPRRKKSHAEATV